MRLDALRDQRLEVIRAALRDERNSSFAGGSRSAGMFGGSALHTDGFRALSVPRGLIGSSSREAIIVSALNRRTLHLEIGEALHLEGLSALQLELRGCDRLQIQRAR